jgi:hypothetical protein
MTSPTPELPRLRRRMEAGYTMVSITSLRGLRRLLLLLVLLQVVNLLFELKGIV